MSAVEIKELRVESGENAKRIMYLTKEFLKGKSDLIDIVSGTSSAVIAARAAETLVRLNYVTYDDIRTETIVYQNNRKTRVVIRLRKTTEFDKLYEENEATKKKFLVQIPEN